MQIANDATAKAMITAIVKLNEALRDTNLALSAFIQSLDDSEWVGIDKASKLTGLSQRQLRYRAEQGVLRTKKNGREYLFFSDDLSALRNPEPACAGKYL